jgi:predicted molibdopterin-dependent oxidoreductase YjgC
MVSLTINGQRVEVEPETTILLAAQKLGYFIPTFCYDPGLSLTGTCGMCVVQVENADTLMASCNTPVTDGMVVYTDTEQIHAARREVLHNLRTGHPLDCLTCEKNGDCSLQDYCYLYGIFQIDYSGYKSKYELEDTNPFFIRDMNKCVKCGLCVRTCQEINGAEAVKLVSPDSHSEPPVFEESSCVFCGMCVDICPVGALIPKQVVGKGRTWELNRVKTVCPYCGVGCGLELHVKDNKVTNVKGDVTSPVNRGQTCVKGRFGFDFLDSPRRLTSPLIRKNGELVESTWDEALSLVAEKLKQVKGEELSALASARVTNEDNYLFQKLIRTLGSNNIDHCARL